MLKKLVVSMILGLSLVFGIGATVAPQTTYAYEGETDDQFVTRVFYGIWILRETGSYHEFSRDTAVIPEIISCDPIGETARIKVQSVNNPDYVRYAIIMSNGGAYGMIMFFDRACTNAEMSFVRTVY